MKLTKAQAGYIQYLIFVIAMLIANFIAGTFLVK